MKQFILIIFSFLLMGPTHAAWQKVGETDSAVFYVDPQKRSKPGPDNVVTLVFVIDYNAPQMHDGKVYMSSTYGAKFDCITKEILPVLQIKNSARRGSGEVVSHIPIIDSWKKYSPSSIFNTLLVFACNQ